MVYIIYHVYRILCNVQCTLFNVNCTLYTEKCVLFKFINMFTDCTHLIINTDNYTQACFIVVNDEHSSFQWYLRP